ncbi:MAG TPA: hypothetical protein VMW66_03360 [Elusimicrobiales bacterium]|nr:hypothetical protein [Elusimicrobiales bacterium]
MTFERKVHMVRKGGAFVVVLFLIGFAISTWVDVFTYDRELLPLWWLMIFNAILFTGASFWLPYFLIKKERKMDERLVYVQLTSGFGAFVVMVCVALNFEAGDVLGLKMITEPLDMTPIFFTFYMGILFYAFIYLFFERTKKEK